MSYPNFERRVPGSIDVDRGAYKNLLEAEIVESNSICTEIIRHEYANFPRLFLFSVGFFLFVGAGRLRASFVQLSSRAENRKSAFLRSGAVGSQAVGMPWRCRPHCQSVMPPDTVAKNASQIPVAFWRFAVVCCLFVRVFGLYLVKKR